MRASRSRAASSSLATSASSDDTRSVSVAWSARLWLIEPQRRLGIVARRPSGPARLPGRLPLRAAALREPRSPRPASSRRSSARSLLFLGAAPLGRDHVETRRGRALLSHPPRGWLAPRSRRSPSRVVQCRADDAGQRRLSRRRWPASSSATSAASALALQSAAAPRAPAAPCISARVSRMPRTSCRDPPSTSQRAAKHFARRRRDRDTATSDASVARLIERLDDERVAEQPRRPRRRAARRRARHRVSARACGGTMSGDGVGGRASPHPRARESRTGRHSAFADARERRHARRRVRSTRRTAEDRRAARRPRVRTIARRSDGPQRRHAAGWCRAPRPADNLAASPNVARRDFDLLERLQRVQRGPPVPARARRATATALVAARRCRLANGGFGRRRAAAVGLTRSALAWSSVPRACSAARPRAIRFALEIARLRIRAARARRPRDRARPRRCRGPDAGPTAS